MPVNLNALVRYKTIDQCLKNKFVPATMERLIEKCSEALSDKKGKRTSISERTIREDLRVLRSNLLDFNAPIVCKDGVYSYEDEDFQLFEQPIADKELLLEIQTLLMEEFDNIESEKVKWLIVSLAKITKKKIPQKMAPRGYGNYAKRMPGAKPSPSDVYKNNLINSIRSLTEKRELFIKKLWFSIFKKPKSMVSGYLFWKYVYLGLEQE